MMSGDVQPRKRKDKRRKKDELGVEEPRGTAAVFGDGDVLMHSHHEHGTGGHWCAKIIFFSLLSVLVTLIVLIILENRGLTELEANSVESRYSGVLDAWIEDTPDDDHHDEHTLDLKHHSYEDVHDDGDDDSQHEIETEHDEDEFTDEDDEGGTDGDGHDDDEDADDDNTENDGDDDDVDHDDKDDIGYEEKDDEDDSDEKNIEEDDDDEDDERIEYKKYSYEEQGDDNDDDDENDGDNDNDDLINNDSQEKQDDEDSKEDFNEQDNKSDEFEDDDDDDDDIDTNDDQNDLENDVNYDNENEDDENEDDDDEEVERIEREVVDEEEIISSEKPNDVENNEEDDDDDDEQKKEINYEREDTPDVEDIEPPIVEQIPVPSGKPFVELEDEPSTEKPTDTLAEEEEYEKRQEQIRLEKEESSSQMWLKLAVGGALLLATHAVIRRSAAPGDTPESEDSETREETPTIIDRRMTLLPRETVPLTPETNEPVQEIIETHESIKTVVQSVPRLKQENDDENQEVKEVVKKEIIIEQETKDVDKELYSDEDEEIDDEEEIIEKGPSNDNAPEKVADDSEAEEVPDDVEIIDDEQIEEEIEDEEDEEEISDVDDGELLSRLEAKYGRLPEPERPGQRRKDGGNNVENEWPDEPSDPYWRKQLDIAEDEIRQRGLGAVGGARARVSRPEVSGSARARHLAALALDTEAELKQSNELLSRAIQAYIQLIKTTRLPDRLLIEVATKTLKRITFRGNYLSAEPVYRILINRFPNEISYRNNLTITFLMANKPDLAAEVLKHTLKLWPNDRVALAHYGFVLKTHYNKLEESVIMFSKALENDTGPACEPRFYYHLGDTLLLLGRFKEAREVHERGAALGHFLSPAQRSLYNVDRLKGQPWWPVEETPYIQLANALEQSWKEILKEGEAARALYENEREGLKEKGEWSQLDLFVRGQEIPGRCKRAPVTCSIVKMEPSAASCRRGQVKFSLMSAGTHVRPHVGPTNCRLRMHLGLSNTKHTYIRVDQEIREWQLGKVLLFDDSFEHEVWHNGTGARLVLIVDVWHPHLAADERRRLPAI